MSEKNKLTKSDIVDGAFAVLKESGFSAVNARSVAKKLGCSTQPIYRFFKNMSELKDEMTARAIKEHSERVTKSLSSNDGSHSRYGDYGIGFVRFAEQEKELFKFLYIDEKSRLLLTDVHYDEIIDTIRSEYGYDAETARKMHMDMTFYSYGLALLFYVGKLKMSDNELIAAFRREFKALASLYNNADNNAGAAISNNKICSNNKAEIFK